MIRIAIVEDHLDETEQLQQLLCQFESEEKQKFHITSFADAADFLSGCTSSFDIVFMDIRLPYINGMDAAKKLREKDDRSVLIFTTTLAGYAIQGYEVNALDYLLKPLDYSRLSMTLRRALKVIDSKKDDYLSIKTAGGVVRAAVGEICYIDIKDHLLRYHFEDGVITAWDSLKSVERMLPETMFVRCNKSAIVNIGYVWKLDGNYIEMKDGTKFSCAGHRKEILSVINRHFNR